MHVNPFLATVIGDLVKRAVRISDVAAAAGVSNTTVSHALNGKGRLPEATRERVRAVARKLGYQPSVLARGLAGGRTGMLAVTVSFVEDEPLAVADFDYFLQVMNGASAEALKRGLSLMLLPTDSRRDPFVQLPLDGAIVMDPVPGDEIVDILDKRGIPVVTTGRRPDGPPDACWVDNDHVAGTRIMVDHLVDRGSTRIALLTAPVLSTYTQDALGAFEARCDERGVESIVEHLPGEALSESGAYAAASRLLESPKPPDGIYATLDRVALGALLAAEAKGISVPQQLRIAGCTDSTASRAARPSLTALSLNPERIGQEAIGLLVELIEDGTPEDGQRIVPYSMIPRGSTAEVG
ncbi:MAG: LacI family transcriptional regulator [Acidobacteria bacterium]|nr:MAG: LacI family transcriptional regulator [Acidobacteriota bacterium]GIK78715.1 MAG: LacI family transcriptional regulator [Actinomycetes bacterium]